SSELQRRPRRTNEFVGEGELPSRHCARPYGRRLRRGTHTIATHLHQFDGRVNATDGTQREIFRINDNNGILAGNDRLVAALQGGGTEAVNRNALPRDLAWRVDAAERGKHHGRVHVHGLGEDEVEGARRGVRTALQLEEGRHRGAPIGSKRVPPAELVEGVVQRLPGLTGDRLSETRSEELELLAVHH